MAELASSRLVSTKHTRGCRVWLCFADGLEGEIDLKDELWGPVFEPLKDTSIFSQLRFDPELRMIAWPNGADFAPEFLRDRLVAASTDIPALY